MMSLRVLFLSLSFGLGHNRAAEATGKALALINPEIRSLIVDSLSYTNPRLEKIYRESYDKLIKRTPRLWGHLYGSKQLVEKTAGLRSLMNKINSRRLKGLLEEFAPHLIVCTHWVPCGVVSSLKARGEIDIPVMNVITDFCIHDFQVYEEVETYIVASNEVKEELLARGVEGEKVKVFGIPIDPAFSQRLNRQEIKRELGLEKNLPTVLILGGGQGLGPIKNVIHHLDKFRKPFQIIVVVGKNEGLRKKLENLVPRLKVPLKVYGYIENMDEIMEVSDLALTKAGGLSSSEALSKGLPMLIVNPIPGQEEKNSEFIVNRGAGIKVRRIKELNGKVEDLLSDFQKLNQMKERARSLAKPKAALDTARIILDLAERCSEN
jgi:processive 1,2-diacylglycerol beta-glucosyltransferase